MESRMRAAVTGGAGFIGAHLVQELLQRGYETVVVDSLVAGKRARVPAAAEFHQIDVCNTEALLEIFSGAQFVFHLAALPRVQFTLEHPHIAHDANVTGTFSVLRAAYKAGVSKVVFSSSCSVYGDQDEFPLHEGLSERAQSPYAMQKHIGELYCRLFSRVYGLATVALRYFNVYGPGDDPNGPYALVITKFLDKRSRDERLTITGDGTQTRDFIHVRDVVRANLLAAESANVGNGEVLNIGSGQNASINRIAELIGGPVDYIAPRLEPHDALADLALAKKLLSWEPSVTLEEGIAELKRISKLALSPAGITV